MGVLLAAVGTLLGLLLPTTASAAQSDPVNVFTPNDSQPPFTPPPHGNFSGSCGVAVDSLGRLYISDYYRHAIDVYLTPDSPGTSVVTQLANVDPLDGPCGLALDPSDRIYVNNYHRNVERYGALPTFAKGPIFNTEHPTGVAVDPDNGWVYVNNRTHVSVYDSTGAPVLDGGEPLIIGAGSLGEAYGVAVSDYIETEDRVYVPDAASNTVKVYNLEVSSSVPVAEIKDPFQKPFVSLRDSAIAVDRATGEIYFADNTQPRHTERPQAVIYVYRYTNIYRGQLKYKIVDPLPPGLAVDNSPHPTKGRVYVTSGNTAGGSVYIYPPDAATTATPLPPIGEFFISTVGTGSGTVRSTAFGISCSDDCVEEVPAGGTVSLEALPDPGSDFAGWSGSQCSGAGRCVVEVEEAATVEARFVDEPGGAVDPSPASVASSPTARRAGAVNAKRKRHVKAKRRARSRHRRGARPRDARHRGATAVHRATSTGR